MSPQWKYTDIPQGPRSAFDEDMLVSLSKAAEIASRPVETIRTWKKRGMPVRTIDGAAHVRIGDLLDYRDTHARRSRLNHLP